MTEDESYIINLVISDFPSKKKEIAILYNQSSSFIELCEDYVLCKTSVERIEVLENQQISSKLKDLKSALSDLQDELQSRLELYEVRNKLNG